MESRGLEVETTEFFQVRCQQVSILLNQNLGSIFAKDKKTALRDCTSLKQRRRIFFNDLMA